MIYWYKCHICGVEVLAESLPKDWQIIQKEECITLHRKNFIRIIANVICPEHTIK